MKNGKSILILSLSGIGNFLMHSPVFSVLKKQFPESHITVWVAPRGTKVLAEHNPSIDAVIEEPIKGSLINHIQQIQTLRRHHFDIGIVLSPGQQIKSAIYMFGAGIPKRLGHQYPFMKNDNSSFLLTDSIPEHDNMHDIEQNLALLSLLGIPEEKRRVQHYELSIPDEYIKKADTLMQTLNIPSGKTIIGIHAGSDQHFLWKRWPLQHFADVGTYLIKEKNAFILLFGGSQEQALKQTLYAQLKPNATIVDSDLLTGAALMKHCHLFLSNDSGLMHLAAAVGIKTYGIFGPTDEGQTGPRGIDSHVIRAVNTKPVYDTEKHYSFGNKLHTTLVQLEPTVVTQRLEKSLFF